MRWESGGGGTNGHLKWWESEFTCKYRRKAAWARLKFAVLVLGETNQYGFVISSYAWMPGRFKQKGEFNCDLGILHLPVCSFKYWERGIGIYDYIIKPVILSMKFYQFYVTYFEALLLGV